MNDLSAIATERNYRRFRCCNKCSQRWSLVNTQSELLPPSAQDGIFPGQKYDYCAACGNARMKRKSA